jgi:antitoxin ParD1/3/4
MAQVNVSLPDGLKNWVDRRVAEGRHSSSSDFIRDVLRRLQEEEEELAVLQAEIAKGRNSGPGRDAFEFFEELSGKYSRPESDC